MQQSEPQHTNLEHVGHKQCWGEASRGQLGQENGETRGNDTTDLLGETLPYVPLGGDNFEAVSVEAGNDFNCAMSVDNAVKVGSEH